MDALLQEDPTGPARKQRSRPTIGLLIGRLSDVGYAAKVWPGIADVARERDVNLICFVGGALQAPHEFDSQKNIAYDLATPENLNGLILMSGSIGQFIGPTPLKQFYDRYGSMPMVSVAMALEGIPSVLVENRTGMREVLTHLIQVHGARRIAFLRGPQTNTEAEERYETYRQVLAEFGIPFDPQLVAQGNFLGPAGAAAVRMFMDERKVQFDAIASANDEMALGAISELRERGLRVPGHVKVIGFDDLEESKFSSPPLTTIQQPLYIQGRKAVEMLLTLMEGEALPAQVTLPTEMILRQSCGCFHHPDYQASAGMNNWANWTGEPGSPEWLSNILKEINKSANSSTENLPTGWPERLFNAFSSSVKDTSNDVFLYELEDLLRQVGAVSNELMQWHRVLDILRYGVLPVLAAGKDLLDYEPLCLRARALVGEIAQWSQANRRLQSDRRSFDFTTSVSEPLMTAFELSSLTDVVASQLPRLGITSCYLVLYDPPVHNQPDTPTEWSRLVVAYDPHGRIDLEEGGRRFLTRSILPAGTLPENEQVALMLEPLHFRDELQIGYIIFGPLQSQAGVLREALSRQISIALKGTLLLQERAQVQKDLKDSEERYRSLLQFNNEILRNAPIGIIRLDTEMRILYENPELERIIGLPPSEGRSAALGMDIRLLPGIKAAGLLAPLKDVQDGKSILLESSFMSIYKKETLVRINGRPIMENGQSIGSVLIVEDITARKKSENALAASEERYRSLAEASHDMIFIIDKDDTINYVNGFAAAQFGARPETIIGKKMAQMFPLPVAQRQQEGIQQVLATNTPFYAEALSRFPGGDKWLGTWLVPLKDISGQPASVMGVSRDITDRKYAERELKEYSERLEERVNDRTAELQQALQKAQLVDRMKSEFLANVNHELRTPLTNLILYYQMLSAHPSEKTKERLDVIGRELQRLRSLIENLLDLSHLELEQITFRIRPHDLNGLLTALVNDRRAMAAERGLTMSLELSGELSSVNMDDALIVQAVSNLLTNAMNYTPSGGKMIITTRPQPGSSGEAGVAISVQDTGRGITPEDLPHIFERFYRGSASHETGAPGTGLGLAIAREVVERHHGTICVENAPIDHGAIFTIWLPLEQIQTVGFEDLNNDPA